MTLKKIVTGTELAALVMLSCSGFVFAGSAQGTSAFQFLQLGVGARPSAMGETFAGVTGDVNSVYWNPAGLAGLERGELSMTHALWLQGITYSNIVYGQRAFGGTIGAAFNILTTGDIQEADNTGLRLSDNYNMSDTMGIVSYARGWNNLSLGANLKYISSRIQTENAQSYAADIGALYSGFRPWGRKLGVGLSVQNLGTKAKYVSEANSLPVIVRAGGSLDLFKGLLVASDLNYIEKVINIHIGAEYTRAFGPLTVALRAGYKDDTVKELGALSGLTAGMGIKLSDWQFDYAWNSFTDLGITHRISMGYKFGGLNAEKAPPPSAPVATVVSTPIITVVSTPVAAVVSAPDFDGDGVADSLDKCPNTSTGTAVDAAGCPFGSPVQVMDRLALVAAQGSITPPVEAAVRGAAADPACPWDQVGKLCMTTMWFDYDGAEVKKDDTPQLKAIAAFLKANPRVRVELQGYADDRGDDNYNYKLSADRAEAVMEHFIMVDGLDAGRFSAKGLGKTMPITSNLTEEGRKSNRRVVAILSYFEK